MGQQATNSDSIDNNPWTWEDALAEATQLLNSFSSLKKEAGSEDGDLFSFSCHEVEEAAGVAFQGYKALVVSPAAVLVAVSS